MGLKSFTKAYIEAALWSSTDSIDDDSESAPLDRNHGPEDIAANTLAWMKADCAAFYDAYNHVFTREHCKHPTGCTPVEVAGHDFWLTRCGHGCGFWDGDWSDAVGKILTKASKTFGNVDLYIGDDGKIYAMGHE